VHYVANFTRQVQAGETVHISIRRANGVELEKSDRTIDDIADCVSGTMPAFTLSSGTYMFEFTSGSERLASSDVVITPQ
jgi:hypothetical protein